MFSTPSKIYKDITSSNLDLKSGIELLTTIVEKGQDSDERLESLGYLKELTEPNDHIFKLLENLLISDSNPEIRAFSASFIKDQYLEKALNPMRWAIQYEDNVRCYISIIKTLMKLDSPASKKTLLEKLESVLERKFIIGQRRYDNRKFKKSLEIRITGKTLEVLSTKEIGEILINHRIISNLVKKYHFVFFRWKDGLINKLDLSELGWNAARTWDLVYEEKVEELSDIPGLMELKQLRRLNLSNNNLSDVKELAQLKNLTYLMLNNNRLEDPINLQYLKEMKNLQFLSIKGNKLASDIKKEEFPKIYLVLGNNLAFL